MTKKQAKSEIGLSFWNINKCFEVWVKIKGRDEWLYVIAWLEDGSEIYFDNLRHFVYAKEITHFYLAIGDTVKELKKDRPKGKKRKTCLYYANKALVAAVKGME